jgi:hypothetical protein
LSPKEARQVIEVFPNPFTDRLTFRHKNAEAADGLLEITDMTGRTMVRMPFPGPCSGAFHLDTEHLPAGVYIFRLSLGGQRISGKLVKSK